MFLIDVSPIPLGADYTVETRYDNTQRATFNATKCLRHNKPKFFNPNCYAYFLPEFQEYFRLKNCLGYKVSKQFFWVKKLLELKKILGFKFFVQKISLGYK